MRVRDRGSTLEVDDVPGMHWLLGLLFIVVGGLFFAGPLGLFTERPLRARDTGMTHPSRMRHTRRGYFLCHHPWCVHEPRYSSIATSSLLH